MKELQMTIRRAPRPEAVHYVECDDGVHNDPRLSWGARGLGQYLLSRPHGWTDAFESLERAAAGSNGKPNNDKALRILFHELMVAGYVRRDETRLGDVVAVEYRIADQPCEVDVALIDDAVARMLNPDRAGTRPSETLRRLD